MQKYPFNPFALSADSLLWFDLDWITAYESYKALNEAEADKYKPPKS